MVRQRATGGRLGVIGPYGDHSGAYDPRWSFHPLGLYITSMFFFITSKKGMLVISKISSLKTTSILIIQTRLQMLNTNNNNQKDTNTDLNFNTNSKIVSKIKNQKLILKSCLITFCIIIFLINFHFFLFFDLQMKVNDKLENDSFFSKINETNHSFSMFNRTNFHTLCLPKGINYVNFMEDWWPVFELFFTFFIPFLTITVTFVFILLKLKKLNRIYLNLSKENSNKLIYLKKIQRNKLVLLKLFFVNFYFFISIFPYFLFKTFLEINYPFLNTFFTILFYSNNAFNIVFYGISCQTFRQAIVKRLTKTVSNCKKQN